MNKHLLIVKATLDKKKAGISARLAQASITPEDKTKLDAAMTEIEASIKALEDAAEDATIEQIAAIFSKAVEVLTATSDVQVAQDMEAMRAKIEAQLMKLQSKIDTGAGKSKKFSAKLSLSRANKSTEAKDSENFRSFSAGVDAESWTPEAEIDNVEIFRPMIGVAGALDTSTTSNTMVKIRTFGATGGAASVVVKHGASPVLETSADQKVVEVQKYMGVVENVAIEDLEDNPGLDSEIQDVAFENLAQVENDAAIVLIKGVAGAYANTDFTPKVGADEKTALVAIIAMVSKKLGRRVSPICLALNAAQWALLGDLRNANGTPIPIDSVLGSIEKVEDNSLVGDEFLCWAKKYAKLKIYKGKTSEWYQGVKVIKDGANVVNVYSEVRTDEKSLAMRVRQIMYTTDASVFVKGTISGVVTAVTPAP